jgi:hypothetical protein
MLQQFDNLIIAGDDTIYGASTSRRWIATFPANE